MLAIMHRHASTTVISACLNMLVVTPHAGMAYRFTTLTEQFASSAVKPFRISAS